MSTFLKLTLAQGDIEVFVNIEHAREISVATLADIEGEDVVCTQITYEQGDSIYVNETPDQIAKKFNERNTGLLFN